MDERAAQLLLNPFPRYADFARLVQWRSMASGQTLFLPITNWSTNSFTSSPTQVTNGGQRFHCIRSP